MNNHYPGFRGNLFGYCYKCNNFKHKITNCKLNIKLANFIHQNYFSPLMENMVEYYKCHNILHIEKFYKSKFKNSHQPD